jgi:hypothetical protein
VGGARVEPSRYHLASASSATATLKDRRLSCAPGPRIRPARR